MTMECSQLPIDLSNPVYVILYMLFHQRPLSLINFMLFHQLHPISPYKIGTGDGSVDRADRDREIGPGSSGQGSRPRIGQRLMARH